MAGVDVTVWALESECGGFPECDEWGHIQKYCGSGLAFLVVFWALP
jgi:hypothetical protein